MAKPILVGAVAYDARVVPIWEGMRDYFRQVGPPIDYILFSNYDRQVQALLDRQIDIAWNTNLAWVKVHRFTGGACRALAMRDVDARFTTILVARTDSGIASLADLRGKRLALGSADSAQAAILPRHFLHQVGIDPERDCTLLRFDLDVGLHGDTGTSELEVLRALREGRADAGALGETTWFRQRPSRNREGEAPAEPCAAERLGSAGASPSQLPPFQTASQAAEGRIDVGQIRPIWTSPGYCHCNFTVLGDFPEDRGQQWTEALLAMSYDSPRWRELMDQEGLKRWIRADAAILEGYRVLFEAAEQQGLSAAWQL